MRHVHWRDGDRRKAALLPPSPGASPAEAWVAILVGGRRDDQLPDLYLEPPADAPDHSDRGAREHNVKDIDADTSRETPPAITGLSGSGKSSLAADSI
jgi:hypothetical protein